MNRYIQVYKEKNPNATAIEFYNGFVIMYENSADLRAKKASIDRGNTRGFKIVEEFKAENKGLTHEQGKQKLLKVKWETYECGAKNCWCLGVRPVTPVVIHDDEEMTVIPTGTVYRNVAQRIVELHNKSI